MIMGNTNYYEPRNVNQSQGHTTNWFGQEKNDKTLFDVIFEYNKIVLLGNPGIGKTMELEILFEKLWNEKDVRGIIPFSINLKNFRKINKFEDLIIFSNWKSLPRIIFILDGLDEIAEIQDFISAFEIFISQNKKLNISYIISCRTNIYEKYLVNISNFESFYLQELTVEQSASLLFNKYGVVIDEHKLSEKHYNYLRTPFFLELFASYVLEKGALPLSDSVMWELFIKKTLDKHEEKQAKKALVDKFKILKNLKKVAFTNELMQQNYSTAEELNEITGDYLGYIENPFTVELNGDPKRWNFTHRQIQEYLVAKSLTDKKFEEVLSIIKIPDIDAEVIHPSLFNTITFLINLLDKDSDLFKKLIDWLTKNQIEILFKADSDRTTLFKETVFQEYFHLQCLEKRLWISTNRTFTVKEIGEFGDCEENFEYLFKFIEDQKEHFRVIISALNLLSFFKPTGKRLEKLRPLFLALLVSSTVSVAIKSEIIRCITSLKLCESDQDYLDKLMDIFETECNKEINAALLYLIFYVKDVDRLFWYIKGEFLRNVKIEKRKELDEVHRGNDWKLQDLVMKFEDSNHFIEIISYYFRNDPMIDLYNHYESNLLDKFLLFSKLEDDFIVRFLTSINQRTNYYHQEKLLLSIINGSGKQLDAARFLIDTNDFSEVRSFIARFANSDILSLIRDRHEAKHIKSEEIIYFRNNLSHYSNDLAIEFETMMLQGGFIFESKLMDENQFAARQKEMLENIQNNFDILFNTEELLKVIKKTYDENDFETIDLDNVYQLSSAWRKRNDYPTFHDSSLTLLQLLIQSFGSLTYEEVSAYLENKYFALKVVLDNLKSNSKENLKFIISPEQKKEIIDWSIDSAEKIDFDNILEIYDDEHFRYKAHFKILKIVLSFQKYFKFPLSQEFLLNCLEFYEIENFSEKDEFFTYLFNLIADKALFDKKVVDNISNKQLFRFILDRHIDYALKNNLQEVSLKIREYFLKQRPGYNLDAKLELYFTLSSDTDLLKECCADINAPICWSAIKLLALDEEENFCVGKAVEYLDQDESEKKEYYLSNAMWVLFYFQRIEAIQYYLKIKHFDFHSVDFADYSTVEDYSILKTLFFRIYREKNDKPDFSHGSSFFDTYVSNLSKLNEESYAKTQTVLFSIKEQLILENSDTRLFNINLLIDYSRNSYINSKSVPLTFNDALVKVESVVK